jgi:hypothetical protein
VPLAAATLPRLAAEVDAFALAIGLKPPESPPA